MNAREHGESEARTIIAIIDSHNSRSLGLLRDLRSKTGGSGGLAAKFPVAGHTDTATARAAAARLLVNTACDSLRAGFAADQEGRAPAQVSC